MVRPAQSPVSCTRHADQPAHSDVNHDILKSRLNTEGNLIAEPGKKELQGELERIAKIRGPDCKLVLIHMNLC